MDIIEACETAIEKQLGDLNQYIDGQKNAENGVDLQTQTMIDAVVIDKDNNLDRILDQQAHIKMIIDQDGRSKSLKRSIAEEVRVIEVLRKSCAKIGMDAIKNRQSLIESQSREIERFQVQQLKSIAEDYHRHQIILEQRKKEISNLKKEIENEENNREAYLADVEKNLKKQLQNREQMRQGGTLTSFQMGGLTDEVHDPDHIELTSVDEYALYGNISHSAEGASTKRGGVGGRGRGRRKKQ